MTTDIEVGKTYFMQNGNPVKIIHQFDGIYYGDAILSYKDDGSLIGEYNVIAEVIV